MRETRPCSVIERGAPVGWATPNTQAADVSSPVSRGPTSAGARRIRSAATATETRNGSLEVERAPVCGSPGESGSDSINGLYVELSTKTKLPAADDADGGELRA